MSEKEIDKEGFEETKKVVKEQLDKLDINKVISKIAVTALPVIMKEVRVNFRDMTKKETTKVQIFK